MNIEIELINTIRSFEKKNSGKQQSSMDEWANKTNKGQRKVFCFQM